MTLTRETIARDGRVAEERWPVPLEEAWLHAFLSDIFQDWHEGLSFGPLVEGAAYELRPPGKPVSITLTDGYLTVHYGRQGHFHLCIGRNQGAAREGGEDLIAHRAPGRAEIFRTLDREGAPIMWGFRMRNGKGEPMLDLFFPSPFLTDDDQIAPAPDWSRLGTWAHVRARWIEAPDDGRDRLSKGFGRG